MRTLLIASCLIAGSAQADLDITFRDGAPKDRFTITNTGACAVNGLVLTLDLSGAAAGVIFDITDAGDGVEVFQPFEVVVGGDMINSASTVTDGDQVLMLDLNTIAPTAQVGFTIDLDDTAGGREITVSGAEIAGASVLVTSADGTSEGVFDETGLAVVSLADCTS